MRLIAFRNNGEPDDPDAYWRRRFFILGGGLAVLMLLAWLFGGGGPSKQATQTAAARAAAAARQEQGSLPSAAYGSPYGASASAAPWDTPSASPSATASAGPSPSASASGKPSPSPSASSSAAAAAAKKPGKDGQCAAGSVVLSLFTSQATYQAGQEPTFNVYAVSTSPAACRLTYGPAAVRVLVTRSGKVVWDSRACPAARQGAQAVHLTPGVPQEVALSWNPKAPGRSCAGTLPHGGSGTFEATAQAAGHSSPVRSFKLLS